jgi:hypothetical protein
MQSPKAVPPLIKSAWLQKTIENLVVSFKSEETRQWLQVFIVDPVLSYVMDRFLPYIIMIVIVIVSMILLTVSTFLIVFFRMGPRTSRDSRDSHEEKTCIHCDQENH